jgi:hypothetical protein
MIADDEYLHGNISAAEEKTAPTDNIHKFPALKNRYEGAGQVTDN